MRLQNIKKDQKGFTIVELLIVIVVIGILAAITIVAFNGIQNRAKDTKSSELANQLRGKVASWQAVKGAYPTQAQITAGLDDTDAKEAKIDAGLLSNIYTGSTAVTNTAKQIAADGPLVSYQVCTDGARIYYFQSGTPAFKTYDVGTPTACA